RRLQIAGTAALCGVLAGSGTALAASQPDAALHVTVLNVGSAPAVLVQSRGSAALIDGGSSPAALTQALGRVLPPFTTRIDMVVITGGEQAAVAGLAGLIGHYAVSAVLAPDGLTAGAVAVVEQLVAAGANAVNIGDTQWTFGGAVWRCLRYHAQTTDRDDCAVDVAAPSGSVIVLGAAGSADQDELSAMYPALHADLLVTPPGGALSTALLATLQPRHVAVPIASGAAASPAPQGVATIRTGSDGDLAFTGGEAGLQEDG
ncbi:MAG: hypothetical protein JOZ92_01010, partial [Candidatus Dormibacteraeota bacterium]|nr:hypothetical protein [Candidatus Dormibacteraeota bacterium]